MVDDEPAILRALGAGLAARSYRVITAVNGQQTIDMTALESPALVVLDLNLPKFTIGAWVPIVVVPAIIIVFRAIKGHYDRLGEALAITPDDVRREDLQHTSWSWSGVCTGVSSPP